MSIARNIKIELEIHAITCPGVWLCQNNGEIELTITALGYVFSGKPQKPRFPLCYHERFTMDGYFSDVNNTTELEKALDEEQINFTLWQKGRRLAYYSSKIAVILNYTGCMTNNFAITDNAIIMTRGSYFPGIISPKIEYTASIQYTSKCIRCNQTVLSQSHGEKRILKNLYQKNGMNEVHCFHQKPVCHAHTKQRHRWRRTENIETQSSQMRNNNEAWENDLCDYCSLDTKDVSMGNHAHYIRNNTSTANEDNCELETNLERAKCGHYLGESIHSENKCVICLKYASLFDRSIEINGVGVFEMKP